MPEAGCRIIDTSKKKFYIKKSELSGIQLPASNIQFSPAKDTEIINMPG
jgi:hypothetical protein